MYRALSSASASTRLTLAPHHGTPLRSTILPVPAASTRVRLGRSVRVQAISADVVDTPAAAPAAAPVGTTADKPKRANSRAGARRNTLPNKNRWSAKGGERNPKGDMTPRKQRNLGDAMKASGVRLTTTTDPALSLDAILQESPSVPADDPAVLRRINSAIKSTKSLPAALKLVEDMAASNIAPNEQTYVSLMLVCRKQRQAERALVVYEAMKAAAVPAGLLTFNLLLRCTAQARRHEDALRIKEDMEKLGVVPDATTYTCLIGTIVKAGSARGRQPPAKRLVTAFELFQEMKGSGISPTADTYNVLIEACAMAQQVDQAMAVYLEMVASAVAPNQATFSLMMRTAGASGRLQHALAVFGEMKAAGIAPNLDIYNHLIVACGNAPQPQVERAFEIFYEMQNEGRVAADEVTFNALISAACKGGLPSYAFDAFDAMKTANIKASLRTYNELIHAAGLRGVAGAEAAFEVYDSMRLSGELPDTITFSSLIAACARARDADRALQIFEEMLEVDCAPNLVVYHALIAALGRAGRWEEALQLYETRMRAEDSGIEPTLATISILFDCCLGQDGAEAALAAVGGIKEDAASSEGLFAFAGATAAKGLYRQVVVDGLLEPACAGGVSSGEASLRVDIRLHTRSAAIVALLCLLDDLHAAVAAGVAVPTELVMMTGGKVRNTAAGPGRPSKLLLTAQALLAAMRVRCKPLSTLTVQALVVDKAALTAWLAK